MTVKQNKESKLFSLKEFVAKLIGDSTGDDTVKAVIVSSLCKKNEELRLFLWNAGFCGLHYKFLDASSNCPRCLKIESIMNAEHFMVNY